MASKKEQKINFEPLVVGNKVVGFRMIGMLLFSDFKEEVEGRDWALPLRARGNPETGELVGKVVDGKWVQPDDYMEHKTLSLEDAPLYVMENGMTTLDPYIKGTRQPAPGVMLEARKATPHRDFRVSIIPENIKWDDGQLRKLGITIKANNPLAEAVFAKQKQEKVQRMQASVVKGAKNAEDLDRIIAEAQKRRAELVGARQ